jgi:hypothetical protein
MMNITRIPPKIALSLASLTYLAVAYAAAYWSQMEPNPIDAIIPVVLGYPIFLIIAVWKGIEIYSGRRIVPRLNPDPHLRTKAQARVERRATIYTLAFAGFVSVAPIAVALYQGTSLSLISLSPLLVWGWLLHAFGLNRMRLAFIMMTSKTSSDALKRKRQFNRFRDFTLGMILSNAKDPTGSWWINYDRVSGEGVPTLLVKAHKQNGDSEIVAITDDEMIALFGVMTDDGNPYHLLFSLNPSYESSLDAMTAHEKIEAAAFYANSMARVPELRAA